MALFFYSMPSFLLGQLLLFFLFFQLYLPVIIGVTILSSALIVTANIVVDLVQAMLDPRVRT